MVFAVGSLTAWMQRAIPTAAVLLLSYLEKFKCDFTDFSLFLSSCAVGVDDWAPELRTSM